MEYDKKKYAFPFVTWEQYKTLLDQDRRFKLENPQRYEFLSKDAEHRLLHGCNVCGFEGILKKGPK